MRHIFPRLCSPPVLVIASAILTAADVFAAVPAHESSRSLLPLSFEADRNDGATVLYARGLGYQFGVETMGASLLLQDEVAGEANQSLRAIHFDFINANPKAELHGADLLPGKVNYLIGNDPSQWRTRVSLYAKARVTNLYPGIDAVYYGNGQKLEYDLELAPGADPRQIALRFTGVDSIRVDTDGDLVLKSGPKEIRQPPPLIYQVFGGHRQPVQGNYVLNDSSTVGFALGAYDSDLALVIDPMLSYSTFFGGNLGEIAYGVKVGGDGSIYIAGETTSRRFTFGTPTNFVATFSGGRFTGDAFIAKLAPGASNLVYFTYIGGNRNESARDLAIDAEGHAFITGLTDSTNFPTLLTNATYGLTNHLNGKPDPHVHIYRSDAFVTELDTDGASLVYSALIGGSLADVGLGIALDPDDTAYITGYTFSSNFPVVNAFQTNRLGTNDIFVAKIAPFGASLDYSSYLGGTNDEQGQGIAVDGSGVAYVTGFTFSTNFPTTPNALQSQLSGSTNATQSYRGRRPPADAFLLRIDTTQSGSNSLTYSTLLGGTNNDYGLRVAADADSNVYVTGSASSTNFPDFNHPTNTTAGAVRGFALNSDAFLTKYHFSAPDSATMVYSILFGGHQNDIGWDLAVDGAGNAYVCGSTLSHNFPTNNTFDFLRSTNTGQSDGFVAVFDTNAASIFSGYLGGHANDFAYALALDSSTNIYVVGRTFSPTFPLVAPTNQLPLQLRRNGPNDAFLTIISNTPPAPPSP
jgi:hypothetical protein